MSTYVIHSLELGPMQNFIYIIKDNATNRCAVIDPAWDVPAIDNLATTINGTITDILLTHSHFDHINGIKGLLNRHDAQLHLLRAEYTFWGDSEFTPTLYDGGDVIPIGTTEIRVLHTAGHTPGSACFHVGDDLFTGDTLFVFGCGRCDLEGGDPTTMYATLKDLKTKLPKNTVIHPGHNYACKPTSTMHEQIHGNPFFHISDMKHFAHYRMLEHGKTRTYPFDAVSPDELSTILKH